MKKCFINGVGCISGQNTDQNEFLKEVIDYSKKSEIFVVKPDYKAYIPPAMIRRMSSGVKNSIVAANIALKDAAIEKPGAIITGTGMGCINDSEKFLGSLLENDEQYLTPTSFIQSTHNTVAGQIALGLKSKVYNFTYVHAGNSFESALIDGMMLVQDEDANDILIGGVDELGKRSMTLYRLSSTYKKEDEEDYAIFQSKTSGAVPGEAASFFVLGKEKSESTYAEVADVAIVNELKSRSVATFIRDFLQANNLKEDAIDVLVLGNSGDVRYDSLYTEAQAAIPTAESIYFKHLFGEFHASSAVGMWVGANIIKQQTIPEELFYPRKNKSDSRIKNVLVYNHFNGKDHGLMLLKNG